MKIHWKLLIICIAIPLLVGGLSALISSNAMESFEKIEKPSFAPPSILFPIVWSILYVLMGIALYLILTSGVPQSELSLPVIFFALQLIFNFFWSILFFNLELYYFSFAWLVVLWILIAITILLFYKISKPAALLLIPYILWVTFAGVLNLSIAMLN